MASARRTGTQEAVLTYGNGTRDYQVSELTVWEQLTDITLTSGIGKATISGLSGSFAGGETISWSGGADVIFLGYNTTANKSIIYFTITSGTPANGETLTGVSSGATATCGTYTANTGCSPVLECYDDAASFNDYVALAGATTSSSYFRIIRPAVGQGHDGTPNNGVTFASTSNAEVFSITETDTQVQDIIASLNFSGTNNRNVFLMSLVVSGKQAYIGCIAYNSTNSNASYYVNGFAGQHYSCFIDCLAHNIENVGFNGGTFVVGQLFYFYNCSATNCATGFNASGNQSANSYIFKNCLAISNTTDFATNKTAGTMALTCCASSDLTANDWGGTGNIEGISVTFVNSGGDDFHLASTDTSVIGQGTDLSADTAYAFDDDIDKQTRSGSWDIGFDEYFALGMMTTRTSFWGDL